MQAKILIVAESIDIEDSSGSKANVALINNLKKGGFDLLVYHYTKKEIHLKGVPCKSIQEDRRSFLFFLSRLERYLRILFKIKLYKPIERTLGFSFTLLNDRNSIFTALRREKTFNPDLVVTLSKGGSFRPHHALLKLPLWHSKWLAYIHDPYPMHLYPPPYTWTEPGHGHKYSFVKTVFEKARFLAFPSKLLMEWMLAYFPGSNNKGLVIPHQISDIKLSQSSIPEYIQTDKFTVVHAGNLLWGRDPKGLLKGFKLFLKENPTAKERTQLLFLGGKNHYSLLLDQFGKENHQFYNSNRKVTYLEVQKMQASCSVNVILEAKSYVSPFLPGKFPHCVMADKPILLLGPEKSESRRLLGEDYPLWAEIDDVKKIAAILKGLYEIWEQDPNKLKLKRKDLENYLSPEHLQKTIAAIT